LIFRGRPEIPLADRIGAGGVSSRLDKVLNLRGESICTGADGAAERAENKFINQ
jgi:hypothetical protein